MSGPKQVVFITPTPSQPRYHRRILACLQRGESVTVCAFRRGLYEVNALPPDIRVIDLGPLRGGNYLRRLLPLLRAVRVVRSLLATSPHGGLLYCFGLDCALLGLMARRAGMPLVYEVADLIYLMPQQRRVVGSVMQLLDRFVSRAAERVVLTSEGYVSHYGRFGLPKPPLVVENKVSTFLGGTRRREVRRLGHPVRIGVIGLIYYLDCLRPLLEFAAEREDVQVHLFGDGPDLAPVHEAAKCHPHRIVFHGPFRNPADLADIYDLIDINYVVYDPDDDNVRRLTPNKLYESLWFGSPLIVTEGTLLAERVRTLGIGHAIDGHRIGEELARLFAGPLVAEFETMQARALAVPDDQLIDESDRLMGLLLSEAAGEGR